VLHSEVMCLASSAAARKKNNLMVLDGGRLIARALSRRVQLSAIYCSRPRDVDADLSADIISSGTTLYQLSSQQTRLARDNGIVSSLFGNCFMSVFFNLFSEQEPFAAILIAHGNPCLFWGGTPEAQSVEIRG